MLVPQRWAVGFLAEAKQDKDIAIEDDLMEEVGRMFRFDMVAGKVKKPQEPA